MNKFFLEAIIFISGALTMVFELSGSRILGPYFGASIFIWTSLIGIIMGSLSIGYWLGGIFSVRRSDFTFLAWVIFSAGFFMFLTITGNTYILDRVVKYIPGLKLMTIVSAIILFGPASIFLGMILPYSVKLKISNLRTSGITVGNLYALSTIGSIIGTFLAGFVLIPAFGFKNVLFTISVFLILISVYSFFVNKKVVPGVVVLLSTVIIIFFWFRSNTSSPKYIDADTQYNRVLIYNSTDKATGRPVKILRVNNEQSSAMFTDKDDDLVFEVLKYYRLIEFFNPGFKSSLMIGGSGYAFPKDYLRRYPNANIDVVEIDPGLTRLARKYFDLQDNKHLTIIHEDGRTYLNKCTKKYDAVFMDAYKSLLTIPYQLTTLEALQKIYTVLNDNGAVYANIISSLDEENSLFFRSEIATYKKVFPQVYLFAVQYPHPTVAEKDLYQNFLLVGLKSDIKPDFTSQNEQLNNYLGHLYSDSLNTNVSIFTDEFAPVEFLATRSLK